MFQISSYHSDLVQTITDALIEEGYDVIVSDNQLLPEIVFKYIDEFDRKEKVCFLTIVTSDRVNNPTYWDSIAKIYKEKIKGKDCSIIFFLDDDIDWKHIRYKLQSYQINSTENTNVFLSTNLLEDNLVQC